MRFHGQHNQSDPKEIEQLVRQVGAGLLVTEHPRLEHGVYHAVWDADRFFIHLGRTDDQCRSLVASPRCRFIFLDMLSVIPSYWIDARYGGAANQFFRYAEFECTVRVIQEPSQMMDALQKMMDHFQPEGNYDPLDPVAEVYRDKLNAIAIGELTPVACRSKWNLGQSKPSAAFDNVIRQLQLRNKGQDRRTAEEMLRWR